MITVIINGTPFEDFVSKTVRVSLRDLSNDFSFTASAVDGVPPLKQGDEVQASIDGVLALTGVIDEVEGVDAEGSHLVVYSGRDRTADFVDSQLDVLADIVASPSLTLKRVIESIISHLDQSLKVIDDLRSAPFNEAEDIITPEVGQGALALAVGYARKRQALLTSNGDGDIVIASSRPSSSGAVLQRLIKSDSNNILSQSWKLHGANLYRRYIRKGNLDPRAANSIFESDADTIQGPSGEATDSTARVGRQNVVVESESYSSGQLADRAKWAKQLAQAKAVMFNCVVKGHSNSAGDVWQINTTTQINSELADITREMLLQNVTFTEGEGAPTVSSLEFVEKNVYTINEQVLNQRAPGAQNDDFSFLG